VPTSEDELTDRQRDVLRLHREGKNPTEIGKELDISSQGVHGHLRRLRAHGLIEELEAAAPKSKRAPSKPRDGRSFDPADTIRTVVRTITAQLEELSTRETEIDAAIAQLRDEKKAIAKAREQLTTLMPAEAP
jgi:predicted ArsR family transcriptional regulator